MGDKAMTNRRYPVGRRHSKGVALIIALIALVALTLASLGLVRSVDTGLEIAGNMAFKEASVAIGDLGTETAIKWLKENFDKLDQDGADGSGYYASTGFSCDLTGGETPASDSDNVAWESGSVEANCNQKAAKLVAANAYSQTIVPDGYSVYFIVNRMCNQEGRPDLDAGVSCNPYPDATGGLEKSTKSGASYANMPLSGGVIPYYRITAKIIGPRNTVSYTQTLVSLI
jgi:type IV pilus assembly protein PilX